MKFRFSEGTAFRIDVVTGKLDVHPTATRVPDETNDSEPLDGGETLLESDQDNDAWDAFLDPEQVAA